MRKAILISMALMITISCFATHNMAGDISCAHIAGNTYRFTVRTFCNTVNTGADRCELYIKIGSDSIIVHRINGASIFCALPDHDGEMICTGVKYNLYQGDYTFPGNGTYNYHMEDPNRSDGICNVPNSINTSFILSGEMVINPFLGNIDTLQYTGVALIPNNIGVISNYNPRVQNAQSDSLYFDFVLAGGITLPPASNTITINHQTGEIIWDSPNTVCDYIFDIRLKEYRNIGGTYYYIGSTMQEIFTSSCSVNLFANESTTDEQITIFPNPNEGKFEIKIVKNKIESIRVMDLLGNIIKTSLNIPGNDHLAVDISEVDQGIYFVQITDQNKNVVTKQIIIQ